MSSGVLNGLTEVFIKAEIKGKGFKDYLLRRFVKEQRAVRKTELFHIKESNTNCYKQYYEVENTLQFSIFGIEVKASYKFKTEPKEVQLKSKVQVVRKKPKETQNS